MSDRTEDKLSRWHRRSSPSYRTEKGFSLSRRDELYDASYAACAVTIRLAASDQ